MTHIPDSISVLMRDKGSKPMVSSFRPKVRKMEANNFRESSSYSWLWQAGERNI